MTHADRIRAMSDDELAELLTWGMNIREGIEVPSCEDGCKDFGNGCAFDCSHEKRERNVRKWLQEEM